MVATEDLKPGCKLLVGTLPVSQSRTRVRPGDWVTFLEPVGEETTWFVGVEGGEWVYIAEDEGECDDYELHKDGHWYWHLSSFNNVEYPEDLYSDCDFSVENDNFADLFL